MSQVKKAIGAGEVGQQLPPNLTEEWELQVKPKEIVGVRKLLNGTEQALVVWEGLQDWENTWEGFAIVIFTLRTR